MAEPYACELIIKGYDVRGCRQTTSEPFRAPPSLITIHLPNLVSCPDPATNSTGPVLDFLFETATSPVLSDRAHATSSSEPLGGEMNCSELITPGAGIDPTREKERSFVSSFHNRISPSHDPVAKYNIVSSRLRGEGKPAVLT